jgi:hypothetical protein
MRSRFPHRGAWRCTPRRNQVLSWSHITAIQIETSIKLRSFEADGGLSNKQNVRMETSAGYAVEQLPGALRIL